MCYDIKATYKTQLKRAERKGDRAAVEEIMERLIPLTDLPLFHASGFTHPELLIYTDRSPDFPEVATWGLVPHWVKDEAQLKKSWNTTLNARGETIFEKASFRESAKHHRCILYVDGFYEHHHYNKNTYPFYISKKDNSAMALGCLYTEWTNPNGQGTMKTFSIVTSVGNRLLGKIHNNPKLDGARMPLILPEAVEDQWLRSILDPLDRTLIQDLIKTYPDEELKAHPVASLRGKTYQGNVEGISDEVMYEELVF